MPKIDSESSVSISHFAIAECLGKQTQKINTLIRWLLVYIQRSILVDLLCHCVCVQIAQQLFSAKQLVDILLFRSVKVSQ